MNALGGVDGSLYTLVPVRDLVFKRLQLLQAQLARHIQHFGGLNPRGHRYVCSIIEGREKELTLLRSYLELLKMIPFQEQ